MIMRYSSKLSGPLMDRIDLHISTPMIDPNKLMNYQKGTGEVSKVIREKVTKARSIQQKRFKQDKIYTNATMKNSHIKKYCKIEPPAMIILKQAVNAYGLSARSYFRIIKVSQTIADLNASPTIKSEYVAEALQYRIRSVE